MQRSLLQTPSSGTPVATPQSLVAHTSVGLALAALAFLVSPESARADVNGDGDPDVIIAMNAKPNRLWLSDGSGGFTFTNPDPGAARHTRGVAVGDLNGDGRLDAIFVGKETARLWLGDGAGGFAASDPEPTLVRPSSHIALGDLDGDGDLDAVMAGAPRPNRVLLNDGAGNFTGIDPEPGIARESLRVAIGDLDCDGDLDVVFANNGAADRLWLGDGAGGFVGSDLEPGVVRNGGGVAVGDLDEDGDLDIVISNRDQPNRVFLNDGSGAFTGSDPEPDVARRGKTVALGDVNGDGHLDTIIVNTAQNRLWLGDGAGGFTGLDPEPEVSRVEGGVAVADLDGDGNLDAVFAGTFGARIRLWTGDGAGGVTGSHPDAEGPDDGQGVAILPLARAPLTRTRGFLAPQSVRAKPGKRLTVRAILDLGPEAVDLAQGATITYGSLAMDIPAFTPNAARTRWTYTSDDRTFRARVNTPRSGTTSKARLAFTVKGWSDALPASGDSGELLRLSFASGDLDAGADTYLVRGKYRGGRGRLAHPPVVLSRMNAYVRDGRPSRLALTAEFAGDGTVPTGDPTIRLTFGEPCHTFDVDVSASTHTVERVGGGYRFTPREGEAGESGEGVTSLTVDYVRRRLRLVVRGVAFGEFPTEATAPFVFGLSLDPAARTDRVEVRARRKRSGLSY